MGKKSVYVAAAGAVVLIGGVVAAVVVMMSSGLSREDATELIRQRHFGARHVGWRLPVRLARVAGTDVDCGARTVTYLAGPGHDDCVALLEELGIIVACASGPVGGTMSPTSCSERASSESIAGKGELFRLTLNAEALDDEGCTRLSSSGGPFAQLRLPTGVFDSVTGLREEADGTWTIEWSYHQQEDIIDRVSALCGTQGHGPGSGPRTARSRARLYDDGWRIEDTELSVR